MSIVFFLVIFQLPWNEGITPACVDGQWTTGERTPRSENREIGTDICLNVGVNYDIVASFNACSHLLHRMSFNTVQYQLPTMDGI